MKYFGNLVHPGRCELKPPPGLFPNLPPSSSIVVFFSNNSKLDTRANPKIGDAMVPLDAPPESMNAVVVSP